MREAKNVAMNVNAKGFSFELNIMDEDLIEAVILALDPPINQGVPIRIIKASSQALSKSQSIFSRVLTNSKELRELADDVKNLLRIQRGRI